MVVDSRTGSQKRAGGPIRSRWAAGRWAALIALVLLLGNPAGSAGQAFSQLRESPGVWQTFLPTPVDFWDDAAGPLGHHLTTGTVFLYRQGAFVPEITGPAGERIHVPPGTWFWMVEAEGWVSSFTSPLVVEEGGAGERTLVVPMVPACHLSLDGDERWMRLDRLDVVALDEQAVFALVPRFRRELWIPAGPYLAYGVRGGSELSGLTPVLRCRPQERQELSVPEPPASDRQSLLVTLRLPETLPKGEAERQLTQLEYPGGRLPSVLPSAVLWQGQAGAFFFVGAPAEMPLEVVARHPLLRTERRVVSPLGGSVREAGLGELRMRQDLEIVVDYQPVREHADARLELELCAPDPLAESAEILVGQCDAVESQPLALGGATYRFAHLDSGQYLLNARIDDELVPGLGRQATPYLEPEASSPPPVDSYVLRELEVYGNLLAGDDAVPGVVRIAPWGEGSAIPRREAETDEDLVYHLDYFARYPEAGFVETFPEEIRSKNPEDLPGLYCCFVFTACDEAGRCRPFNIHSLITGDGRFDIELPAGETVEIRVVDGATGLPISGARVMLRPQEAFHFYYGKTFWAEPLGIEPETLVVDDDGRVVWTPPEPGPHRIQATAAGYESSSRVVEVAEGERVSLTLELERKSHAATGARFVLADGSPAAGGALVAFDAEGSIEHRCSTRLDADGYARLDAGCETNRYVFFHPLAAVSVFDGTAIASSAELEAPNRGPYPPRVRVQDETGRPVEGVWLKLRIDGLIVDRNAWGASGLGLPFNATSSRGEVVLYGVSPTAAFRLEVAPWWQWEGDWVAIDPEVVRRNEVTQVVAAPVE